MPRRGVAKGRGVRGREPPWNLADQLTLFKPFLLDLSMLFYKTP